MAETLVADEGHRVREREAGVHHDTAGGAASAGGWIAAELVGGKPRRRSPDVAVEAEVFKHDLQHMMHDDM